MKKFVYIFYICVSVFSIELMASENSLSSQLMSSSEVVATQSKAKNQVKGKKNGKGWLKSYLDGQSKGECFGYEVHAKKDKQNVLDRVGFYYCEGDSQMTSMKFKINIYDMSEVEKSPSDKFVSVLNEPIYFEYTLGETKSGKYEFSLPTPVVLPDDAMIEIEMLENLNDNKFWFKSNLLAKKTWARTADNKSWEQNPFASPFFIEYSESKK